MKTNVIGCSALTIGLLVAVQAFAQAGDCTVSGKISFSSSSRITTASLSIKNIANGDTKSVSMKRDGSYVVRQLLPGTYEITVSAPGFDDSRSTVTIGVNDKPVVNLVLEPASTAAASRAQVGSSTAKGNVTTSVSELPLNGRSAGGIIGASTRSGTREFHGSVYEFFRNSALDARNFFDTKKPRFRRNQFGASLGGPIIKDRTFIFGDYEGLRSSLGVTQVDTVPSTAARAGNLSTGQIKVDPTVLSFVNAFYPLPNGSLLGAGDTGIFTFSGQQVTPENYFTTKVDHKLSEQDAVSGTYMFDTGTVRQPDELNDKRTGYDSRRQVFTVNETHTFNPHFLSSSRFGISRVVAVTGLTFASGNAHASDGSFGTVPGKNAAEISVTGLTLFSGGLGTPSNYHFHWTSIQACEDLSLNRAKHSLKFGFGVERARDNILGISDPGGTFSFNSLSDFLTNVPFFLSAAIPSAITERGFRQTILAAYIQDDWRWRPNVTVTLGLRYEMATVPTEVQGKLTVLRHITDATPHLGDPLFSNPTRRNFEPRVGFSWDPFSSGKTEISAGVGMFDVLPLPYLIQTNELFSAPFYQLGSSTDLPAGSFPSAAFAVVAASSDTC